MRRMGVVVVLLVALPALAGESAPPPSDVKTVPLVTGDELTLGPFTTENYLPGQPGKSDPINLIFLNTDPRAIRQRLLKLEGPQPGWEFVPMGTSGKGCVWMDAMGYEQAAYLEPEGWVGGVVQLVCTTPGSPLGNQYRFHLRLFRSGPHTIGGAHFEINIPGTAEHEVLSWDMAREFVATEMARLDPNAFRGTTPLYPFDVDEATGMQYFRFVRPPIYYYFVYSPNPTNYLFLAALNLGSPDPYAATKIPASGLAAVFAPEFGHVSERADFTLTETRVYSTQAYKPFCGREPIQITGGPLTLTLRIQTNPSGKYQRTFTVAGNLEIKTLTTGVVQDAIISQSSRGMLTDNHGQVSQEVSQVLLPNEQADGQSLYLVFGAGKDDYWLPQENCSIPQ